MLVFAREYIMFAELIVMYKICLFHNEIMMMEKYVKQTLNCFKFDIHELS